MTGAEIVPAAMAAKKLVGGGETKGELDEFAKDSPAMAAAAESRARRIAVRQAVMLKLFAPLGKLVGLSKDYFETDFAFDMAKKIADIPEEDLVPPKPSVAVPAMQALGYSLDDESLKEMYLNLLATATDKRTSDNAHPSFAEVIRQLDPEEAALLAEFRGAAAPIMQVVHKAEGSQGYRVVFGHVLNLVDEQANRVESYHAAVWVDNWVRLGLYEVSYRRQLTKPGIYDWVSARPELAAAQAAHADRAGSIECIRGVMAATNFGMQFRSAVMPRGIGE